jgi:hypothetical protein
MIDYTKLSQADRDQYVADQRDLLEKARVLFDSTEEPALKFNLQSQMFQLQHNIAVALTAE